MTRWKNEVVGLYRLMCNVASKRLSRNAVAGQFWLAIANLRHFMNCCTAQNTNNNVFNVKVSRVSSKLLNITALSHYRLET